MATIGHRDGASVGSVGARSECGQVCESSGTSARSGRGVIKKLPLGMTLPMSYDLGVWEGDRPKNDDEALETWGELAERYLEDPEPPTPRIARYIEVLLERWPDTRDDSPWASSGTGDASGPVLCINIMYGRQTEPTAYAADLAREHGLVCVDLQEDCLLS